MIITSKEKRALRTLQADKRLTKTQLADELGITRQTLRHIIDNDEPQRVNSKVYQSIIKLLKNKE